MRTRAVAAFSVALASLTLTASAFLPSIPARAQASAAAIDPTGTWGIDAPHSQVGFSVAHLGVSKTRGKFNAFEGVLVADPKNLAKSSVSFTIQAVSIDTGNPARDNHLRSADFFEVEKYPTITFQSTKIEKKGRGYQATGNLTMHGVTRTIRFPFTITGPVKGMGPGEARAGVQFQLALNRKEYGLTWNRLVEGVNAVGESVDVSVDLEAIKK